MEKFGGPGRVQGRLVRIQAVAELGFGKANEAHCFEGLPLALPRRLQRGIRRADCGGVFALAHLHQYMAIQRLRVECRRPGGLCNAKHRLGVVAGACHFALRDETFRTQVEQVEPGPDTEVGLRKRRGSYFDRVRMLTGPRQVPHLLGDGRSLVCRSARSGPHRPFPLGRRGWHRLLLLSVSRHGSSAQGSVRRGDRILAYRRRAQDDEPADQ